MFQSEHLIGVDVTVFSDNIVIVKSKQFPEGFFVYDCLSIAVYINAVQLYTIVKTGILPIRGGITFGEIYNEDNVLFGEGLIGAYETERVHAFYPRIVLRTTDFNCEEMISTIVRMRSKIEESQEKVMRVCPIALDFDGMYFCNYLSTVCREFKDGLAVKDVASIEAHMNYIDANLTRSGNNVNVLRKYHWMKNYHNWFCQPFAELRQFVIQSPAASVPQQIPQWPQNTAPEYHNGVVRGQYGKSQNP